MSSKSVISSRLGEHNDKKAIPASKYSYDELAEVYNQARVDYIVPMPMNGKRMKEYTLNYDIDLDASVVSLNEEDLESGVGMVGFRDERAWITRLGVVPHRRGRKLGQFLMEVMLDQAIQNGKKLVQLEVIVGNEPAHNLFLKLGFVPTRELLIVRRAPGAPTANDAFDALDVREMDDDSIPEYLARREEGASWVEETASLLNTGRLRGLTIDMPSGEHGWLVYQRTPFQLTHFVVSPGVADDTVRALLYHVHKEYAKQDTKVENVPADHATWPIFQEMGYFEVFRRTEMFLTL